MLVVAALVLGVLAFGPQAVLSDFKFSFSNVQQCGPFIISFSHDGLSASTLPLTLTVLPFNSRAISIPILDSAPNSTGIYVTFLPLAAGTSFIASVDDATGENAGKISDVIKILPSSNDNSTCLPPITNSPARLFKLDGTLSQCATFNIDYDPTVVHSAPSVRSFSPEGSATPLNMSSNQASNGTATYLMSTAHGKEVVLLIDDSPGDGETTQLITVGGDSTSDATCLSQNNGRNANDNSDNSKPSDSSANITKYALLNQSCQCNSI